MGLLSEQFGEGGIRVMRQVKAALDPQVIMKVVMVVMMMMLITGSAALEAEERGCWILLLGQWLHQGDGSYRRFIIISINIVMYNQS